MLFPNTTRVILLRHGESTYNALGLYQGSSNQSTLTDTGIAQARLIGQYLHNIKIDKIYTSPLQRAQKTAQEIFNQISLTPDALEISPLLKEVHLPNWEGLSFEHIKTNFPEDYRLWKTSPHQFSVNVPPLEISSDTKQAIATCQKPFFPALDIYQRCLTFWEETLPRHGGQTILVVSHGGTNRALIGTALGLKPAQYHQFEQVNCAINILHFSGNCRHSGQLLSLNQSLDFSAKIFCRKTQINGLQLILVPAENFQEQNNTKLTSLLDKAHIDFSVSRDLDNPLLLTESVLNHHPNTLHLQLLREDFPKYWVQKIKSRSGNNSETLLTGLVLANKNIIKQLLGQALELTEENYWRLELSLETISIVHYGSGQDLPTIQGINLDNLAQLS